MPIRIPSPNPTAGEALAYLADYLPQSVRPTISLSWLESEMAKTSPNKKWRRFGPGTTQPLIPLDLPRDQPVSPHQIAKSMPLMWVIFLREMLAAEGRTDLSNHPALVAADHLLESRGGIEREGPNNLGRAKMALKVPGYQAAKLLRHPGTIGASSPSLSQLIYGLMPIFEQNPTLQAGEGG